MRFTLRFNSCRLAIFSSRAFSKVRLNSFISEAFKNGALFAENFKLMTSKFVPPDFCRLAEILSLAASKFCAGSVSPLFIFISE